MKIPTVPMFSQIFLAALLMGRVYSLAPWSGRRTTAIPKDARIVILPGFGNASEDYTMDRSLVPSLLKRGWDENQIRVLPVQRGDWLQVFLRGALDLEFWKANAAPTRPAFKWYLDRVRDELQEISEETKSGGKVILVGHSAGGWLGRAALGFGTEGDAESDSEYHINIDQILGIVTLGAPNLPPPPGVMDMTRGALRITNERFPGSYHSPSTFYVTVVGDAVQGQEQKRSAPWEPTTEDGFAFQSYEAVCGDGNAVGDGVVPVCAAHVDDAIQLDLTGVYHSINRPEQWYGSDAVIDQWHDVVLDEIAKRAQNEKVEIPNLFQLFQSDAAIDR